MYTRRMWNRATPVGAAVALIGSVVVTMLPVRLTSQVSVAAIDRRASDRVAGAAGETELATALASQVAQTQPNAIAADARSALVFVTGARNEALIANAWFLAIETRDIAVAMVQQVAFTQSPSSSVEALQAVAYAALAKDPSSLAVVVGKLNQNDRIEVANAIVAIAERVDRVVALRTGAEVLVYAVGDVRTATVENADDLKTGTGSLGAVFMRGHRMTQASITIASTQTEVTDGFGASVLAPGQGRAFKSGLFVDYDERTNVVFNLMYANFALQQWRYPKIGGSAGETELTSASILGAGLIHRFEIGCCRVLDNGVSTYADIGLSTRWISGDVSKRSDVLNELLANDAKLYVGPEVGLQIQFGRVVGSLQLYYLGALKGAWASTHVNGLTRLQAVAAFTVTGEVFRGPMTRGRGPTGSPRGP